MGRKSYLGGSTIIHLGKKPAEAPTTPRTQGVTPQDSGLRFRKFSLEEDLAGLSEDEILDVMSIIQRAMETRDIDKLIKVVKKRLEKHGIHEARSLARAVNYVLAQRKIDFRKGEFVFSKKLLPPGSPMIDESKWLTFRDACRAQINACNFE